MNGLTHLIWDSFGAKTPVRHLIAWAPGILAIIFLAAAVTKWIDPVTFAQTVTRYEILPDDRWVPLVVWTVPALELVLGIALLRPRWRKEASVLALGLLAMFTVAIVRAWILGLETGCGCFGPWLDFGSPPLWIARNLLLMALLAFLLRTRRS